MKRIVLLFFSLMLAAGLMACGRSNGNIKNTSTEEPAAAQQEASAGTDKESAASAEIDQPNQKKAIRWLSISQCRRMLIRQGTMWYQEQVYW